MSVLLPIVAAVCGSREPVWTGHRNERIALGLDVGPRGRQGECVGPGPGTSDVSSRADGKHQPSLYFSHYV